MRIALFFLVFSFASVPFAATAQEPYVAIEHRLTAEQLKATGLDRLSPAELKLLNQLLRDEQADAKVPAEPDASAATRLPKAQSNMPVQSRLTGEFRGWVAGTLLQLENGQTWRVTEGEYHTRAQNEPKVVIHPGLFGSWYMQVEGRSPRAKVRRIK